MELTQTLVHQAITQQQVWLNVQRALSPADLRGRIVLLDFWTYCCVNCMHVMPDLERLEREFGDDLTVIGVHSAKFPNERDTENIRAAILRHRIQHAVVNDSNLRIWRAFSISCWPTFVLINPQGKVEEVYAGEGNYQAVRRDISRLRKEYGADLNNSPLPYDLEKDKEPDSVLRFPGKIIYVQSFQGGPIFFVSDSGHNRIVGMRPDGKIILSVGAKGQPGHVDGRFSEARFNTPQGLLYQDRALYVADTENHLLRKINFAKKQVETVAGTGRQGRVKTSKSSPAESTPLSTPWDLSSYPTRDDIVIAMAGTHQLWVYRIRGKALDVLAGNGRESIDDGEYPNNSLSQPSGLSAHGPRLYFVDSETSSLRALENGQVTTLIGRGLFHSGLKDGDRDSALMQHCLGVFADDSGVFIADSYNHCIRRYDPATGTLETIAGNGKRGVLNEPGGLLKLGEKLYIADTNNHRIMVFDLSSREMSALEPSEDVRDNERASM